MTSSPNGSLASTQQRWVLKAQAARIQRDEQYRIERETKAQQEAADKPESLYEFIPRITPKFKAPRHLSPLIEALEAILRGERVFVYVHVPAQHQKTQTLLHFIAKYLKHFPHRTVGYAGYNSNFAASKALMAQKYIRAAGVEPDPLMQNRREWRTLQGGGLISGGVDSGLTGQSVDLMIVDDPFKDDIEASSLVRRNKVWSWFESVVEERYQPHTSVIVVHTRWHEDDLAGRLIKNRPQFKVIRIPALADGLDALGRGPAPDPLGREIGEPLLPDFKSKAEIEFAKNKKPHTFYSMYQGLPRPREGRPFGEPTFYHEMPKTGRKGYGLDLAYTRKTTANWTVVVEMLEERYAALNESGEQIKDKRGNAVMRSRFYVTRVWRWQDDITQGALKLKAIQQTRPGSKFRVENNGPQKAVNDQLAEKKIRLERYQPTTDKLARSLNYRDAWNSGDVLLPDPESEKFGRAEKAQIMQWLPQFLEVHQNFTGMDDADDDDVDAGNHAYQQLQKSSLGFA